MQMTIRIRDDDDDEVDLSHERIERHRRRVLELMWARHYEDAQRARELLAVITDTHELISSARWLLASIRRKLPPSTAETG
jgi:uncharacterized membrane protein YccC